MVPRACKPPQLSTAVYVNHTFRYAATGSFGGSINLTDIQFALGCMYVSLHDLYAICNCFKVNSIEIWAWNQTASTTLNVILEWCSAIQQQTIAGAATLGNSTGCQRKITDTSGGEAHPAHIRSHPPKGSLASQWQTLNIVPTGSALSSALFNLSVPAGAVIDMNVSYYLQDGVFENTSTASTNAGTIGNLYYAPLDGVDNANVLIPVGLPSLI